MNTAAAPEKAMADKRNVLFSAGLVVSFIPKITSQLSEMESGLTSS